MTEINIEREEQIIGILRDISYEEFKRGHDFLFIEELPTNGGVNLLARGLEDDDYSVHWPYAYLRR